MRRTGLHSFAAADREPLPVINTTPLIDLMLVLLVMFIVSIPMATHKLPMDVPTGDPPVAERLAHRLILNSSGRIFWNGRPIGDAGLAARLADVAADPNQPELHIAADGQTRYERVNQILAAVRRAGITRLGFVGNERFARALD